VEQEHDLAIGGALIDVRLAQTVDLDVVRLVRPFGQILEAGLGRAHEVDAIGGGHDDGLGVAGELVLGAR
jgi:hypothetical protein